MEGNTAPSPDREALARTGERVRRRLAADPSVYRVPVEDAELFAVGDFASRAECTRLIALIDEVAQPSTLFTGTYRDAFRTSYSGNFDANDPFVKGISRRIDDLLGLEASWGETIQGQRYLPGQEFKPHCDWLAVEEDYWEAERVRGGQRSWTAMVFLNEVEEGGATDFPDIGVSIEPRTGTLLAWNNAMSDGRVNWATMHAGTPVKRGVKYVLTRWYRTRKWR
jgi:prolyl 4-hydroxylase